MFQNIDKDAFYFNKCFANFIVFSLSLSFITFHLNILRAV